ncbi:DUF6578 domain-containing protein [Gordonia sp. DT101]|uniref:DUF6578 domain-containing protein n=1 Tax=Gordonia sp. DT101 TaxID=3416545 RepID=UPI003CEE86F3
MIILASPPHDPVYAHISSWEYGCCGTTPTQGAQVTGSLSAFPADPDHRFLVPAPTSWDSDLDLIRFPGGSAHWAPDLDDPRGRALMLSMSWHETAPVRPEVVATITAVYETSTLARRAGDEWHLVSGSREYTSVTAAERHPHSAAEDDRTGEVRSVGGVVVGLAIDTITEPGPDEVAEYRAARERAVRTVHLTGPAEIFGTTVPARGERLSVDLSDPDLDINGGEGVPRSVVRGEVGQVSISRPVMPGLRAYVDVEAGTPAAIVTDPLFVVLTIDADVIS